MSYDAIPLTDEEESLLERTLANHQRGENARFGPWFLPRSIDLAAIKSMPVYPDDVWIVTPPKCGTTWTQEIVWLLKNGVDTTTSSTLNQFYRVPFIELGFLRGSTVQPFSETEGLELNEENVRTFMAHSLDYTLRLPRPRIVKTHLAFELLPDKLLDTCKVIFVSRNLKDACVSLYYHKKLSSKDSNRPNAAISIDELAFKDFANLYKRGLMYHAPFQKQIREAWRLRKHPNMLFLTYEDMKKDIDPIIRRLMDFLEVDIDDVNYEKLKSAVDIDSFRKNEAVNKNKEIPPDDKGGSFIRKGMVGDWKNHFDEELSAQWDEWIQEEFRGSEMEMVFEL